MRQWCPVLRKNFLGDECILFNGEKCKEVDPQRCINEMEKRYKEVSEGGT